jgi:hypothetical protein
MAKSRAAQIAEITRWIARERFHPRDFFYTQPPSPHPIEEPELFCLWKKREQRRKPIAQQMYLYGLTAHDLVPPPSMRKAAHG